MINRLLTTIGLTAIMAIPAYALHTPADDMVCIGYKHIDRENHHQAVSMRLSTNKDLLMIDGITHRIDYYMTNNGRLIAYTKNHGNNYYAFIAAKDNYSIATYTVKPERYIDEIAMACHIDKQRHNHKPIPK